MESLLGGDQEGSGAGENLDAGLAAARQLLPAAHALAATLDRLGLEDALHAEAVKEHIALLIEVNLPELNPMEPPEIFYIIEVALDSGAANHVLSREDIPGYAVEESPGSKAGQQFLPAGGKAIDNEGRVSIVMHAPSGEDTRSELLSCFQVAKVTRPLISVSRICSKGTLGVV
jgi:hypothetical protein